jgi:hypothetical protein
MYEGHMASSGDTQIASASPASSIDDVLREYAKPFVAVGWTNGGHASQAALDTAAVIWDLVIDGLSSDEIVAVLDEEADAHVTKLVAAFVQRKHALFAADRRYVVGSRIARWPARRA